MIAEFLKISSEDLSKINNVNVRPTLEWLKALEINQKRLPPDGWTDKDIYDDLLESQYFSHEAQTRDKDFKIGQKIPYESFETISSKIKNNDCDLDNLQLLIDILNFKDDEEKQDYIKSLNSTKHANISSLIACFPSDDFVRNPIIEKVHLNYSWIFKGVETIDNFLNEQRQFSKVLISLKNDMKLSKPIWENIPKGAELVKTLSNAVNAHVAVFNNLNVPLPSVVAGFLSSSDLLHISEDIKSPWFKKHFALGANTEQLSKALEPFYEISKKIQNLFNVWEEYFHFEKLEEKNKRFQKTTLKLETIEQYVELLGSSVKKNQIFDELEASIKICETEKPDVYFMKELKKFGQYSTALNDLFEKFIDLETELKKVQKWKKSVGLSRDKLHGCVENLIKAIPEVKEIDDALSTLAKISSNFYKCISGDSSDRTLLKYVYKLQKAHNTFFESVTSYSGTR